MGWMKHVMQQVLERGRIYIEEPMIDLLVLQHGWDFAVRYMPVATATGMVAIATITPKTAWRLLRLARHPTRRAAEEAFDYGRGIKATTTFLEDALEQLGYQVTSSAFQNAKTWGQAKTAPPRPPSGRGAAI
jgi:hypothetical protein